MESAATPLIKKLVISKEELFEALNTTEFYKEWITIGIAIALAWLVAAYTRKRIKDHFATHPPRRIDSEFILKPLRLLAPILALFFLGIGKSLIAEHINGIWIDAVTQFTFAYIIARTTILIIRSRGMGLFIASIILIIAALDITGFTQSTAAYLDAMAFEIGKFKLSMLNLVHGIVILVVVFWLAGISSSTLESYLRRSSRMSYSSRELSVKFFKIFVYFIAFITTLSALGVDLTAFAVFGGALGVGIGLGLQRITSNFVSGVTLLVERSIQIGDMLEVGGTVGWVREMNMRFALLETGDGRELLIPNEELISTRVINWTHTHPRARIDINVSVDYQSDPKLAQKLMIEAALEHKRTLKDPAPTCWLREFGPNSLNFVLHTWIADVHEGRLSTQSDIMFTILDKFKANGVEIPLPQQVAIEKQQKF